ncbi:MAG: hypothetical protein JKY26_06500 [Pseudomonas sp.]|nr:hypothetical protein [Pseudomonas sp.]
MSIFLGIVWFICLLVSIAAIFELIGFSGLVRMFPEGRRWWQFPAQVTSLIVFAVIVLLHPFSGGAA